MVGAPATASAPAARERRLVSVPSSFERAQKDMRATARRNENGLPVFGSPFHVFEGVAAFQSPEGGRCCMRCCISSTFLSNTFFCSSVRMAFSSSRCLP